MDQYELKTWKSVLIMEFSKLKKKWGNALSRCLYRYDMTLEQLVPRT